MTTVPMTAAGCAALKAELRHQISVERVRLVERFRQAIVDDPNLIDVSDRKLMEDRLQSLVNEANRGHDKAM